MLSTDKKKYKRKRINLTMREDIIADSKTYNINASEVSEAAMDAAVKKAKEEAWVKDNWDAIQAYNKRINTHGLYLKPYWMEDEE